MNWELVKKGKVRDVYMSPDKSMVGLVASDRVSAFDDILPVEIPGKGSILTEISAWWMEAIEYKNIIPTAYIAGNELATFYSSEYRYRLTIMDALNMLPVECVVRGYMTGSIWKAYKAGDREFCGIHLPDGLHEYQKLPEPIFTPTTKEENGHDLNLTKTGLVIHLQKKLELDDYAASILADKLEYESIKLYKFSCKVLEEFETCMILADTKYEFGIDDNGRLILADEANTPDSARYWPKGEYSSDNPPRSLDKQIIRDYVAAERAAGRDITKLPDYIIEQTRMAYTDIINRLDPIE